MYCPNKEQFFQQPSSSPTAICLNWNADTVNWDVTSFLSSSAELNIEQHKISTLLFSVPLTTVTFHTFGILLSSGMFMYCKIGFPVPSLGQCGQLVAGCEGITFGDKQWVFFTPHRPFH